MRCVNFLWGAGATLLVLLAGMSAAQAAQRDAAAKALGEMQNFNTPRPVNRAFSYAPQSPAASPMTNTEQPQATTPAPQPQDNSTRSFSYQAAPSNNVIQMNRRETRVPGFLRAERKALGDY